MDLDVSSKGRTEMLGLKDGRRCKELRANTLYWSAPCGLMLKDCYGLLMSLTLNISVHP